MYLCGNIIGQSVFITQTLVNSSIFEEYRPGQQFHRLETNGQVACQVIGLLSRGEYRDMQCAWPAKWVSRIVEIRSVDPLNEAASQEARMIRSQTMFLPLCLVGCLVERILQKLKTCLSGGGEFCSAKSYPGAVCQGRDKSHGCHKQPTLPSHRLQHRTRLGSRTHF